MNYRKALAAIVVASTIVAFIPNPSSVAQASSSEVNRVIQKGKNYLGTPYEFGSSRSNTRTFDCSDFTRQAFLEGAGVKIPSNSREQAKYVKKIGDTTRNWKNLDRGDLMFFMDYEGNDRSDYDKNKSKQRITHVGIYIGDGKVLHTYSKVKGVTISSIDDSHWEYRFIFGGRALK